MLFSHPKDFTPVCTTELGYMARIEPEFAKRNCKIIGIFVRLWKRDGKPFYPTMHPRIWGYLERNLAHPALAPVRAWFDSNVPAEYRNDACLRKIYA